MDIIVLLRVFKKGSVLKGIIGLIIPIYTYYWGWKNSKAENLSAIMWVWTLSIVLRIVVNFIAAPGVESGSLLLLFA
jgi:hypothetical protein